MHHAALSNVAARIALVCRVAAPRSMLAHLRAEFRNGGLTRAVAQHDTGVIYDWLMRQVSLQGISDAIAWRYIDEHGNVTHGEVSAALADPPLCPKLRSHWHFESCGYAKQAFSCAEPALIESCPLPRHDLRNGRLNQTAYSLALFLRDVCGGDLVGWIDQQLAAADGGGGSERLATMRAALLGPLGCIYGVSSKVLAMSLADLLLAGDPDRERWVETGASMIAVDSLVHNWLHRTGSLRELGAEHPYGPGCYGPVGCAAIIEAASKVIDARTFCPEGPAMFPRLIQSALWRFCAEGGLDVCNGNRIDDRTSCAQSGCLMFPSCGRLPLRISGPRSAAATLESGRQQWKQSTLFDARHPATSSNRAAAAFVTSPAGFVR